MTWLIKESDQWFQLAVTFPRIVVDQKSMKFQIHGSAQFRNKFWWKCLQKIVGQIKKFQRWKIGGNFKFHISDLIFAVNIFL